VTFDPLEMLYFAFVIVEAHLSFISNLHQRCQQRLTVFSSSLATLCVRHTPLLREGRESLTNRRQLLPILQ
jgi:hypothetical protein